MGVVQLGVVQLGSVQMGKLMPWHHPLQRRASLQEPGVSIRDAYAHKNGRIVGKLPKGGGVISDPKHFVADLFGNFEGEKQLIFRKRGGGSRISEKCCCRFLILILMRISLIFFSLDHEKWFSISRNTRLKEKISITSRKMKFSFKFLNKSRCIILRKI